MKTNIIYALDWTEYESGWGCRPDGLQVFTSREAMDKVLERDRKEREAAKSTPSEYSIPTTKYVMEVDEKDAEALETLVDKTCLWFARAGERDIKHLSKLYPSLKVIATENL
jgi:hypothetical protein